jgi:cytoskeletal protein RodZ
MTHQTTTPSHSTESQVHPALDAVLESLDIDLEKELKRYRRYQAGKPVPTVRSLGTYHQSSSPPAIGISTSANPTESLAASVDDSQEMANSFQEVLTAASNQPANALEEASNSETETPEESDRESTDQTQNPLAAVSLSSERWQKEGTTDDVESSPFELVANSGTNEGFADQENDLGPKDYLESSQALLQDLETENTGNSYPQKEPIKPVDGFSGRKKRRRRKSHKPWGGIFLLLLLLTGGAIAYLWQHPQLAARLQVRRFFPNASQPTTNSTTNASNPENAGTDTNFDQPMDLAPNLAKKEFIELELDNLSTVNPNPQTVQVPKSPASQQAVSPTNQTSPSPSANSNPIPSKDGDNRLGNLPSALMGEPPSKQSNASPETTENQSEPSANSESMANEPSQPSFAGEVTISGGDGYFYVVMPYDGPSSLERAREAIDDAYVREFPIGKTIQLGAFDDMATAKEMVKRLSQQGIQSQVYQP